ncbi:S-adenosyl-L-methionine-dependent methyltransferase [Xylariales sp. PMI_506]|nr:S-adenosyl-L-methionine-dependent methyltransferase [Xylariales sp. PMI_506]
MLQHGQIATAEPHGLISPEETPCLEPQDDATALSPEDYLALTWDLSVLPSQALDSYEQRSPPQFFPVEDINAFTAYRDADTDSALGEPAPQYQLAPAYPSDQHLIISMLNDAINKNLDREPSGSSVVEPDSVLGESGRLYHGYKEGKYFFPNDAAEQDRLDLQHEGFRLLFDGWLALAPLESAPKYVLDIGCGTGIWASEFAEQNPSSYVIGIDLSAIQPTPLTENCAFAKADAEDDWIFPDPFPDHADCTPETNCQQHMISFDYVHLRLMFTCFGHNVKKVMQHAFDNMNSGGWIEFQESEMNFYQANPHYKGDACKRWGQACIQGARVAGRDIDLVRNYKEWLEEIGFVDVVERHIPQPGAPWHVDPRLRRIGQYTLHNGLQAAGAVWPLLRASGMTAEGADGLVEEMKREISDHNNHGYSMIYIIYGRKP